FNSEIDTINEKQNKKNRRLLKIIIQGEFNSTQF
ncbi:hypothetical protein LCGC14_2609480, partial [marine sediment metagenome]